MFRSVRLASAVATNTVAAASAVSIDAAVTDNGVEFPGFGTNAVLCYQLAPGSTPGAYTIVVQESSTSGGTYSTVLTLTEASATGTAFANLTLTKPYARVNVTDATANAGTFTADLLLAG